MDKVDYSELSDEELLLERKKMKQSKQMHALLIGFLGGIVACGLTAWMMSDSKNIGFFIPMAFPIFFIYKMVKKPNPYADLELELKGRQLM
jgi:hypothetical protein